jgi:hypothetical protein
MHMDPSDSLLLWTTENVRTRAENGSRLRLKGWPVIQPTTTHRGRANKAICRHMAGVGIKLQAVHSPVALRCSNCIVMLGLLATHSCPVQWRWVRPLTPQANRQTVRRACVYTYLYGAAHRHSQGQVHLVLHGNYDSSDVLTCVASNGEHL